MHATSDKYTHITPAELEAEALRLIALGDLEAANAYRAIARDKSSASPAYSPRPEALADLGGNNTEGDTRWAIGEGVALATAFGLDFHTLRMVNLDRCETAFHPLHDWSHTDWATALGGEAGEYLNKVKKQRRGEYITTRALADELADLVIYADLAAAAQGIDLGEAVKAKFNLVSEQKGVPHRL